MQKNRLGTTDSTQKKIIWSDSVGPRYQQKTDGLVCAKPNRRIFAYISSKSGPIDLPISRFFSI